MCHLNLLNLKTLLAIFNQFNWLFETVCQLLSEKLIYHGSEIALGLLSKTICYLGFRWLVHAAFFAVWLKLISDKTLKRWITTSNHSDPHIYLIKDIKGLCDNDAWDNCINNRSALRHTILSPRLKRLCGSHRMIYKLLCSSPLLCGVVPTWWAHRGERESQVG